MEPGKESEDRYSQRKREGTDVKEPETKKMKETKRE